MKRTLYLGLTLLCLVGMSTTAIAKGKPQQQQTSQSTGQPIEQGKTQQYNQPQLDGQQMGQGRYLPCQMQSSNVQPQFGSQSFGASNAKPSRSNKGGRVRGRDRAQQVQQMNNLAKKQRAAGNLSMQQGDCLQPRN
jgi:K+-transporting ATPase c subunit